MRVPLVSDSRIDFVTLGMSRDTSRMSQLQSPLLRNLAPQCTATHCNALQRAQLQSRLVRILALQRTATHCNTQGTELD